MLCGLGAGVAEATLVVTWIETLKVRLIADQRRKEPRFRGLFHAASTIVKEEVRITFQSTKIFKLFSGNQRTVQRTRTNNNEAGFQSSNQILRHGVTEERVHRGRSQSTSSLLCCGNVWCLRR